jgi:hypothetical protein
MALHSRHALAVLLTGLVLGGCGSDPSPDATASPPAPSTSATTPSPTGSGSASPSPSSTLTQAQQKAFDDAVQVVMDYRQIVVDLYSGARTRINDLDAVTTGAFHDKEVREVSRGLTLGYASSPKGVQLKQVSAEPVKFNLKRDPPTVVVRVCIDGTDVTITDPQGKTSKGVREELDYTVVYTTYRPVPVWAVSRAQGAADPKDRAC